jgi:uridine kinase
VRRLLVFSMTDTLLPGAGDRVWMTLWFLGLLARLILIALIIPDTHLDWFLPFLSHWNSNISVDPWLSYISAAGDLRAFPYGFPYLIVYGPLVAVGEFLRGIIGAHYALATTVLALELLLARCISLLVLSDNGRLWVYMLFWLNPVCVYVSYWHGALDVLPVLVLTLSFVCLLRKWIAASGLLLGLAISAKFLAALALPYVILAILREKRFAPSLVPFLGCLLVGLLPFLAALPLAGYQEMVLGTPEAAKVFSSRLSITDGQTIVILPIALGLLALFCWRVGRFTTHLTMMFVALAFLMLYLLTPAPPGWLIWVIPFVSIAVLTHSSVSIAIAQLFFLFALSDHLVESLGLYIVEWTSYVDASHLTVGSELRSLITSGKFATGILLFIEIVRKNVLEDPYYKATRSPISIVIAGDSGSGKDTLSESFNSIFGVHRTVYLSGDDYHVWDRRKPMWQALTHLNPAANYLGAFFRDIESLLERRSVLKREYDHSTGKMTQPSRQSPKDVLLISGLHALADSSLCERFDARVFLAMDERTRRALKIRRDVLSRGSSIAETNRALDKRAVDAERFVVPQKKKADIVFILTAICEEKLKQAESGAGDPSEVFDMTLSVGVRNLEQASDLRTLLAAITGVHIYATEEDLDLYWFRVEQSVEVSKEAICIASSVIAPAMREFVALEPKWHSGLLGIMQLVVIQQVMRHRNLPTRINEGTYESSTVTIS